MIHPKASPMTVTHEQEEVAMVPQPISTALLPCPVCGDLPKWRGTRSDYARGIFRLQCLGETHLFQSYGPSEEKCAENWNTRHDQPA